MGPRWILQMLLFVGSLDGLRRRACPRLVPSPTFGAALLILAIVIVDPAIFFQLGRCRLRQWRSLRFPGGVYRVLAVTECSPAVAEDGMQESV